MAALALLSYTEFGGKLKFGCKKKGGADHASENFNRFFGELGPAYRQSERRATMSTTSSVADWRMSTT